MEELLALRIDDGRLNPDDVLPALIVSTKPRYEESADWFGTAALSAMTKTFGTGGLRLCEACMVPRTHAEQAHLIYQTGPLTLEEIIRLDDLARGDAQPARTAIWIDEYRGGVSVKIVDLRTGGVLYAQNVDPTLVEVRNTQRTYSLAAELERRARGDSLTQAFVDVAVYPQQHFSLDWTDQWGKTNANMSGVTLSLFDPVLGVGACHYRRVDLLNLLLGGKVILSIPTAVANSFTDDNVDIFDPMVTAVGVVRVPFGRSNYGAVLTASTGGRVGIGISLMNISLLPVIP